MLEKVSKYHQDWLNIAKSILPKEDAEDIVQELYLTLHKYNIKEEKIRYKDEINKGFIFIVLKNLCHKQIRSRNQQKRDQRLNVNIDGVSDFDILNHRDDTGHHAGNVINKASFFNHTEQQREECIFELIQNEVDTWSNYDKNLFELYMYSGLSLRELSKGSKKKIDIFISKNFKLNPESIKRGTGISVSSMFHTIKECKQKIRLKLNYEL